jgi:undecaprenyl-diphosphatase
MLEQILSIDRNLLFLVNRTLRNPVFDTVMPFVTNPREFRWIYFAVLILLILASLYDKKTKNDWSGLKQLLLVLLLFVPLITISDQLSSSVLKPIFARMRPCHVLPDVRRLVDCGPGFSFPSSHAVNNFAVATLLVFFYRRLSWLFLTIATTVAYSRVYVGVHYPLDVIGGAFIGFLCGCFVVCAYKIIILGLSRMRGGQGTRTETDQGQL